MSDAIRGALEAIEQQIAVRSVELAKAKAAVNGLCDLLDIPWRYSPLDGSSNAAPLVEQNSQNGSGSSDPQGRSKERGIEPVTNRRHVTHRPVGAGVVPSSVPPLPSGVRPAAPASTPTETGDLTPMSDGGVGIGRTLICPFTPTDLGARLDGKPSEAIRTAYQWIARWKNKGWIETVGFGSYKRTESFGR